MSALRLVWRQGWPLAILLAGGLLIYGGCQCGTTPTGTPLETKSTEEELTGPPLFEEVTKDSGVDHTYKNGDKDEKGEIIHYAILESLGGGGALIDFDGDGLLDIFLCGGGYYDGKDKKEIKGHPCKLYKNLGNFKFKDVTEEAGLGGEWFYTHGAAVADIDNDGWPDLLVTGWHELRLYHNEPVDPKDPGKGRRFVPWMDNAGLPKDLWTSSAAFADFDGDGFADLYVCQYADWSFDKNPICTYDTKTRDVCPPKQFHALPHHVFRNDPVDPNDPSKGRKFTDVSKEAGLRMPRTEEDYKELTWLTLYEIESLKRADVGLGADKDGGKEYGKGLGVITVDVNADGKPDVYVANDTVDNFLYINCSEKGKIRFREVGLASGTARDDRGSPNGSMGLWTADYDRCGRPSIWVANYENEMHALYHNECKIDKEKGPKVLFRYATQQSGIAAIGQIYVGFGTAFLDIDNDGWEDLFVSNGHAIMFPTGKSPRAQRPVLLKNMGGGRFKNWTKQGGEYAHTNHVGRGLLVGDLDNDGRIDLVACHLNEPASVLRNIAGKDNHWLGVELIGAKNRPVIGTRVALEYDGQTQSWFAMGGGSYLAANDPRHVFGLGKAGATTKLTVKWPNGEEQEFKDLKVDRYWRIVEGEEEAREPPWSQKK
jgi:enediyne biosynthesis protein E4